MLLFHGFMVMENPRCAKWNSMGNYEFAYGRSPRCDVGAIILHESTFEPCFHASATVCVVFDDSGGFVSVSGMCAVRAAAASAKCAGGDGPYVGSECFAGCGTGSGCSISG